MMMVMIMIMIMMVFRVSNLMGWFLFHLLTSIHTINGQSACVTTASTHLAINFSVIHLFATTWLTVLVFLSDVGFFCRFLCYCSLV